MTFIIFKNPFYFIGSEFRIPISISESMAFLFNHIFNVFFICAKKQVPWIYAIWGVTFMTHLHVFRYFSIIDFPCYSMSPKTTFVLLNHAVRTFLSFTYPTFGRIKNGIIKSFDKTIIILHAIIIYEIKTMSKIIETKMGCVQNFSRKRDEE